MSLTPYDKDLEWRTIIIVASSDEKGLAFNDVLVHDGEAELWVAREWLRSLEVASELGHRMVPYAHATTSPCCSVS